MKNTTLCYIERDGCYLMLHRIKKAQDVNRDKWVGIGGKLEEDESAEDCLLREAKEETGLTLTEYRLCGVITFVSDRWEGEHMFLYHATGFAGALRECDEGVLEWVPIDRVNALPQWSGDRLFLQRLQQNAPFFTMKLRYNGEELVEAVLNGREDLISGQWTGDSGQ